MPQTAAELLEEIRHLPREEQLSLAEALLQELPEDSLEDAENPELGYDEWFRAGVEEARVDSSQDIQHEQVVAEVSEFLRRASESRRLKASA